MNFIKTIINWIKGLFSKKTSWAPLDISGVVDSNYPREGNGWFKGWVCGKDKIIVCAHSNIAPGHEVFVTVKGERITRKIKSVETPKIKIDGKTNDPHYLDSDISVCTLEEAWPDVVKVYKFATHPESGQVATSIHKDGGQSQRTLKINSKIAWIVAGSKGRHLVQGDSGLPWFVLEDGEYKVVSHTTRVDGGEGPNYSHPFVKSVLKPLV